VTENIRWCLQVRRYVRPFFQGSSKMRFLYDVITFTATRVGLAYMVFPFVLLEFWLSIEILKWALVFLLCCYYYELMLLILRWCNTIGVMILMSAWCNVIGTVMLIILRWCSMIGMVMSTWYYLCVETQLYQLFSVDALTGTLKPVHWKTTRHYSRYCAVPFRCMHNCELSY